MATIAAINTNFTATTQNLEKGTKRAEKMVQGFSGRIKQLGSAALPSIGTIVTGAAIGFAVKRVFDTIKRELDDLGKLSDVSLNLGLAGPQLQKLQFAAGQAGVSADQLATGIAKMKDTIADAAEGDVKEAVDAMKALGLNAKQLAQADTAEQIEKVFGAFGNIEGSTRKIQVARDVLGRAGVQFLTLISDGTEGLEAMAQRAKELGFNLTELDVVLGDIASDSLGEVGIAFDNVFKQIAADLAPAVAVLAESFATLVGSFAQGTDETYGMSRSLLTFIGNAVDGFNNIASGVMRVIALFAEGLGRIQDALDFDNERSGLREFADTWRAEADRLAGLEMDQVLLERMEDVIKRAQEAVARRDELARAIGGNRSGVGGGRDIDPAAVEAGTTAAIEAINKAGKPDKAAEQVRLQKMTVDELKEIKRQNRDVVNALRRGGLAPADLN